MFRLFQTNVKHQLPLSNEKHLKKAKGETRYNAKIN